MQARSALVLASASPRRRELLARFRIPFKVIGPRVDEVPLAGEGPADYALRTAQEKGQAVAGSVTRATVLSADTVVSVEGRILGKPADPEAAREMLHALSGRVHSVYTGVVVLDSESGTMFRVVDQTRVWFRQLSRDEIDGYVRTEAVMDKAGAYAIQGGASRFVPKIAGNYSNVVGLPLPVVCDLLRKVGLLPEASALRSS